MAERALTDCFYFLQSRCTKDCGKRHSDAAVTTTKVCEPWKTGSCAEILCPLRHPEVCAYFAANACTKGDSCPFKHHIGVFPKRKDLESQVAASVSQKKARIEPEPPEQGQANRTSLLTTRTTPCVPGETPSILGKRPLELGATLPPPIPADLRQLLSMKKGGDEPKKKTSKSISIEPDRKATLQQTKRDTKSLEPERHISAANQVDHESALRAQLLKRQKEIEASKASKTIAEQDPMILKRALRFASSTTSENAPPSALLKASTPSALASIASVTKAPVTVGPSPAAAVKAPTVAKSPAPVPAFTKTITAPSPLSAAPITSSTQTASAPIPQPQSTPLTAPKPQVGPAKKTASAPAPVPIKAAAPPTLIAKAPAPVKTTASPAPVVPGSVSAPVPVKTTASEAPAAASNLAAKAPAPVKAALSPAPAPAAVKTLVLKAPAAASSSNVAKTPAPTATKSAVATPAPGLSVGTGNKVAPKVPPPTAKKPSVPTPAAPLPAASATSSALISPQKEEPKRETTLEEDMADFEDFLNSN